MATIKEVANYAKVSVGTVSNVLNGKTQNEELIRNVEAAIEKLGYRPDENARSLKNTKSKIIGVIVSNITQRDFGEFLQDLESRLREKGYSILLKCSRNNILIEKKCIEECIERSVDGIVLRTPLGEKSQILLKESNLPAVLITKKRTSNFYGDSIVVDYKEAFEAAILEFTNAGRSKIGLIMEKGTSHNFCTDDSLIKEIENSQEQGFLAFFELYSQDPGIDGVIADGELIAKGVKKALDVLNIQDFPVVAMKESSWIEDVGHFSAQLTVSQKEISRKTVQRLFDWIEKPKLHENITSVISAKYDQYSAAKEGIQKASADLRFAMYDCSSSRSLLMLTQIYERECGRKIIFDLFSYHELEKLLYQHSEEKSSYYDGFLMDITWLEGLAESGIVQNLDDFKSGNPEFFEGFVEGMLKNLGMYVESLYGIPFMSGAQILFYQKDLFENQSLQMRFKRMYGEELAVPRTWAQFNQVAGFFTRKYNGYSPVKYGASIPNGRNVYTTISFLSRLWSYGSRIFDERGNVVIHNSNSIAALKSFVESYQYTSGNELHSWNDIADEFSAGDSAMAILYDSDAGDINNYTKSKVAKNLGYALIPGSASVLGGWSLGLNRYGKHTKDAENFLLWACGNQNQILLPLLGGSTLRKDFYERSDLENLQPWKSLILQSYQQSRKREMPEINDESRWKNDIYTSLISNEIIRAVEKEISEEEAVMQMGENIKKLVNR